MKLYELATGDRFTFPYFPETVYELTGSLGQLYYVTISTTGERMEFDGSSPVLRKSDYETT